MDEAPIYKPKKPRKPHTNERAFYKKAQRVDYSPNKRADRGNKYARGNPPGHPMKWDCNVLCKLADELRYWMAQEESKYFKSFCYEHGFQSHMVDQFCSRCPSFRDAWSGVKEWQEQRLVSLSLEKKTSESITKFILSNLHGWRERQEVGATVADPLSAIMQKIAESNQPEMVDYSEVTDSDKEADSG